MAERPAQKCNWEARRHISLGPKFRIDANNPRMGNKGNLSYLIYSTTDNKDKSSISLAQDGTFSIYNDRTIEIIGGEGNESPKGQDVLIAAKTGEVVIQADGNGAVRIKATNITLEATEDIDIKAGRNLTLKSVGGQTLLDGNEVNLNAKQGNLAEGLKIDFCNQVFAGSFVGADVLAGILGGAVAFAFNAAKDTFNGN